MGAALGIGLAALLFAFRLDQLIREKIVGELITGNTSAERHKQLMQELKKRNNGKAKPKPAKADTANA
jgi:hypothetical protein